MDYDKNHATEQSRSIHWRSHHKYYLSPCAKDNQVLWRTATAIWYTKPCSLILKTPPLSHHCFVIFQQLPT
ncbi:unnamed protein product [Prunus armeniaca]